jgi:hypothetical protein
MPVEESSLFEVRGLFSGFFRDFFGKRRLVLRVGEDEIYLRVPKALKKQFAETLEPGQEIVARGHESRDPDGKRLVSQIAIPGQPGCLSCPIRVCAKKDCWRNGGKELFKALEARIEAAGLKGSVKLKAVDCLDHCKQGPNMEYGGETRHHCTPRDVDEIMAQFSE